MNKEQFKNIAIEKLSKLTTSDLIAEAKKMSNDFSDYSCLIMDAILDVLIVRMPENEFVALCNEL